MSKKQKIRRILSGVLSAVTVLSVVLSPAMAYTANAETLPDDGTLPALEDVIDRLDPEEIVTASDLELEQGSEFDVEHDLTGIEYQEDKVTVLLHAAGNEGGEAFSTDHADTYQTVYYVTPLSGNPSYQVSRQITVTEPESQTEGTVSGSDAEEQSESAEDDTEADLSEPQTVSAGDAAETDTEAVTETATETESETANGTETETETELEVTENVSGGDAVSGILLMSLEDETEGTGSGLNENKSYVSGLAVKSLTDGTAPFDDDDADGNDSSSQNHIVRTFDYVNYTLEYTTALMNTAQTVDEAYMMVEFVLDCDPAQAEFNEDTLNWCVNRVITYYYSDGTTSTTWDSSRTVEKQVLTGRRYLSLNGDTNAIPGVGTLSVGIYVKAMQNGDALCPTFTVWMEGNAESLYKTIVGDTVTVSAAPRYNIKLARNSYCDYLGYFDPESGTVSSADEDGYVYGRLEGYAVVLQLYNTSVDKGLKGIELPTGDITFDITVTETLNDVDVTDSADYSPILWDYRENMSGNANTVGYLGRSMYAGGRSTTTYGVYQEPWNSGGATNTEYACYDGGTFTVVQDSEEGNVYHVTVKGYAFDMEDFDFPTNNCNNTTGTISYTSNIGCFSAGYVQFVCQFARSVDTTSDLYFKVSVDNMGAVSTSGQAADGEQKTTDNTSSLNVTLYPKGSISKRNFFYTSTGGQIASVWSYGDAYAAQEQTVRIVSVLDYSGDGCLTAANILQKFDDEAFEVPAGTVSYTSVSTSNSNSVIGTVNVLFAAKPDGSGWESDSEMNSTREEELIYFESIDALNAAGYTCVGFLYEVRDSEIYCGASDNKALTFQTAVTVKSSAEIGSVYQTTNDVRVWKSEEGILSWSDVSYGSFGACGLGDSSWEEGNYYTGYETPTYKLYTNYGKSVYQDGSIASGHSGGYIYGNSLLIIGCKTSVTIAVADETTTAGGTVAKSVYDLDANERTATYVIQPKVTTASANSEVETSEQTTDVTVQAILPKGLSYIMNSASITPVDVTENDDGTSTVTWLIENQQAGSDMDAIYLSCTIGAAGTADDVQNNDTLTIAATVTADKDSRAITKAFGNYSDTTIAVIRLATSAVSKTVESSLVEEGDTVSYILRYGNSAEEDVAGIRFFDILPYTGDGRGTDFSGTYVIDSIIIDFSSAESTYAAVADSVRVFATTSESARDTAVAESILQQTANVSWTQLTGGTASGTGMTWSGLSLADVAGLYFDIGTVKGQEYLKITVTLAFVDGSGKLLTDSAGSAQEPGDIYANSFYQYADKQVAMVESNTVQAQVVERTVSGLAWLDEDGDGIRGDSETLLSGVTATLYRTAASGNDSAAKAAATVNGIKLYTAYDVMGNAVEAVKTGADGSYAFSDLEAGTYYVVFTGVDSYGLTAQDAGDDDTADSDAAATVSSGSSTLENAYIAGITLPALGEMYAYSYESSHNDAGFLIFASGLTIQKVEEGTNTALSGAIFVLQDADGKYLTFEDGAYTGTRSKVNSSCYLTTGSDGMAAVDGLPLGTYTLSEYQAPAGYQKSDETWTVVIGVHEADGWAGYVTVDGETVGGVFVIEDQPATTSVAVTKAWKDNSNQDNLRTDITLHLTGTVTNADGGTETVIERTGTIRKNASSLEYVFSNLPAYAYGQAVTYSVTEDSVDGYTTAYSAMDGDFASGYTVVVTNTHVTETTEYTVVKVWDDDDNRDGIRPETVTVRLIGSDGSERTAKLAADDGWQYTFTNLPVYWKEGTPITYTVEESPVSRYVRSVSDADENRQFTVTNTHEIRTVDIPVEKIWDDADDQDGLRAESITVILTGSDGSVREAQLTADGGWQYTFENLPYYWNGGVVIVYSLQEQEVDGYTDEVVAGEDGYSFTVTNNHIPAVTDVVVLKVWEDADDQDGIRPESIAVTLAGSDGTTYETELTAENGYSCLFAGLPVYYNHGTKIVYSVTEAAVEGYEAAVTVDETGYLLTVTNTHEPEVMSVPVAKVWDDNDDQDGIRPESIAVTLTGSNGMVYEAELNAENGWSYLFEDVPVYYHEGTQVIYTLTEAAVEGYSAVITGSAGETGFTVTNIHKPETTEVPVVKVWEDDDDRDGIRPDSIHIILTGSDGNAYETDLTEESGWKAVFTNLPVYFNHGEQVAYTVSEATADGYDTTIVSGEDGYSFTVTNAHETLVTDISVTKQWDDSDNQDGLRPESITVILTGSDGNRYTATLTADNGWAYTFTGLPVYWNHGTVIDYSLQEAAVDGYADEVVKGEDGYTFSVTNNHIPAVADIVVSKVWDDAEDQDGLRPESIHVVLAGSDGSVYEADLNSENGFVYVFIGLPVYFHQGEQIVYTLSEDAVEHYEAEITASEDGYTFVVTNTHEPEVRSITVTKVWDDNGNAKGLRGDVSLTLTGSDGSVYYGTISKDNEEQTYVFVGLPVYMDGVEIIYTLTEDAMEGYTSEIVETEDRFTVTNTLIPEETPEETPDTPETVADVPKTGDDSHMALWIVLTVAALASFGVALYGVFRKKRSGK